MAQRNKATRQRAVKLPAMNRETTDVELDRWGKAHVPGFSGVVARNELSQLWPATRPLTPGASAILNLDFGYRRGGSHWTAVRVSKEAPLLLYVDSFGLPPPQEVVVRARKEGRNVLWSDIARQDLAEVNCGPRALAALDYLAKNAAASREMEAFGKIAQVL